MSGRGWAYAGAALGGVVSIAANVAHSYVPRAGAASSWSPHLGAVVGAVFWPIALFVAIEILARVAWPAGHRWVALRYLGLLPVALVAAVVSYRHLSGLLAFYGEDPLTSTIGPLAVDGLMVMATGALIATGRLTTTSARTLDEQLAEPAPADPWAYAEPVTATPAVRTPARTPGGRPSSASKVAAVAARNPGADPATIAAKTGVSVRTVRRHLADKTPPASANPAPVNGTHIPALLDEVTK